MDYIDDYIAAKSKDGKVSLSDVYHYLKVSFRMPTRTVQWYMKEGLLRRPDYNWKDGFFTTSDAKDILERAYLIAKLKEYGTVKFSTIRNIFTAYKGNFEALLDELIPVVKEFQALMPHPADPTESMLNEKNAELIRRFCDQLEQGVPLANISAADIQEQMLQEE